MLGRILASFVIALITLASSRAVADSSRGARPKAAATVAPTTTTAAAVPVSSTTLAWRAPSTCPDATSLRTRIEARLERSLDDAPVGIEVEVIYADGRYTARIDLRAVTVANDLRTLTSKRCGELADAVAVVIARAASDAIARKEVAAREDGDEPPLRPPVATSTTASFLPERPLPTPRTWAIGARLSGVSGIGVIPKVGLGGELAITMRHNSTLAEIAGTRWVTSAAQFHNGAPSKVDVDLDVAAVRVGWRPLHVPLRAWLAVEGGAMRGAGVALPSQQLESGRWLAAGAGFGIAWQMNRYVRLVGSTETMLAIERVRFSLGDGIIVYAPSPMSVRTLWPGDWLSVKAIAATARDGFGLASTPMLDMPATAHAIDADADTTVPSFDDVYAAHFAFVWRILRTFGVPEPALEDAAQDVFVVVHRRLPEFEGRAAITTWLFAIARRVASAHRRKHKDGDRTETLEHEPAGLADTFAALSRAQAAATVLGILDTMDEDKRVVFALVELEGLSVPEVSRMLEINLNTAYSRLRLARHAFELAVRAKVTP